MFRRRALELLGISSAHVDGDESGADVRDSESNPQSPIGSSISSSSSEASDDVVETCTDVSVLPPPAPCAEVPARPLRVRNPITVKG